MSGYVNTIVIWTLAVHTESFLESELTVSTAVRLLEKSREDGLIACEKLSSKD